ncbi:DHA2 family efflux MFS transporter permease subunit [Nonomuraea longispora]|uniref:DHA2 family efflux MFS transporter permease subunit n=1 Tax=Nonomuraea longispora TaxID=1848320 RepID=A0A4R4NG24_9ACTN|nr:DHA2 family efflux MFS transporter permease subunit [Nonomuraea longispora]TDC08161.1 DHA2 family efflux MFS transporter permease subunit [Nonomuraea longispora]
MSQRRGNPWIVMVTLCIGFFMTILDTTIVNIAIPDILEDLDATISEVLWVMSAYILVVAVLVITAGRLGDIVGPRKVFIAGMVLFTVASALCGAAMEPWQLIAARALQGIGAALITPQTLTILTGVFPPEKRGLPSAIWGVTAGVAGLAGPTLGGLLVAEGNWRWVFYVNVPLGLVTIAMAFALIPDVRPDKRLRLDITGVVLASAALGAITYGLLEGDRYGWGTITSFLSIPLVLAAGLVLLVVFLATQARVNDPLMPLGIFRDRGFSLMSFVVVAVSFGMMGLSLTLTIYLQQVLGLSALQAGLTLAPTALAMMFSFPVVGFLIDKIGGKYVLICGLALYPVSLALIGNTARTDSGQWSLLGPLILAGISQAAAFAPTVTMAMQDVRTEFAGAASGAFNAVRQLGFLIAVAAMGAVLQSRLTSELHGEAERQAAQLPGEFREGFVDAVTSAGGSIDAGAGDVRLPAGASGQLAQQMREIAQSVFDQAFVGALRFTLLTCAAVVVVACLLSFAAKRPDPAKAPTAEEEPALM